MNLCTSIKLSNNLIENKSCTITYSGYLYENNSDSVSIVYGFGDNWNNSSEQVMNKTKDGFVVDIKMLNFDSFNFCFRNSAYQWDNNYSQNFSVPIERESFEEEKFIINENYIDEILENIYKTDFIDYIETEYDNSNKFSTSVSNTENIQTISNIVDDTNTITLTDISTTNTVNNESTEQLNNNEINSKSICEFDLDNLIDDILSPVVNSTIFDEDIQSFKQIISNDYNNFEDTNNTDDISATSSDLFEDTNITNDISATSSDLFEDTNNTDDISTTSSDLFEDTNITDDISTTSSGLFEDTNKNLFDIDFELNDLIKGFYKNIKSISHDLNYNNFDTNLETNTFKDTNITIEDNNFKSNETSITQNINNNTNAQEMIDNVINTFPDITQSEKNLDFTDTDEESSLIDAFVNQNEQLNIDSNTSAETSLVEVSDNKFLISPRSLSKFQILKKKVKFVFHKVFSTISSLFTLNFEENDN